MATKISGNNYIVPEAEYLDLVRGKWKHQYSCLRHEVFTAFTEWNGGRDRAERGEAISRLSTILSNYPPAKEYYD